MLKRALAERYSGDREAYTEAKSEFVKRHELPGFEFVRRFPPIRATRKGDRGWL